MKKEQSINYKCQQCDNEEEGNGLYIRCSKCGGLLLERSQQAISCASDGLGTPLVALSDFVGSHVVHRSKTPHSFIGDKLEYKTEDRDVILMALSGKWAMVRRPRCSPYVTKVDELVPPTNP